ncbi:MAG: YncE family protein [Myxococcota bacterium]|nr:YncE family protein [Myxococcota bacterium]
MSRRPGLISALLVAGLVLGCSEGPELPALRVLVVNTESDSVSLVDLESLREVKRFDVGESPYGVAVTRDGSRVAVGLEGEGKVAFHDAESFALEGEVRIGPMHHDHIVLSPDGSRMLVANYHSDSVVLIDPVAMKETGRIEGTSAPHVVKYEPAKKRAFVTCKKITGIGVVDPAREALLEFHQTKVNPRGLTFSPDGAKVYFASFWVDGFFQMDAESGEVERLFALPTPPGSPPREVTYHGVEAIDAKIVLAANEGRSWVDAVDVRTGALIDRLEDVSRPCCIERVPGREGQPARVLVSNLGDGTLQLVEVSPEGRLHSVGKARVGEAPKRVAFLPAPAP